MIPGLECYQAFMRWDIIPGNGGKNIKVPIHPLNGHKADITDPANHCDYQTALTSPHGQGVAFVIIPESQLFFIDIDDCLQNDGNWSPAALSICALFSGAGMEISYSGRGLHIIGRYTGPRPAHRCKNSEHGLELYTGDRFVALTGMGATGDALTGHSVALQSLITSYFQGDAPSSAADEDWTTGPVAEWDGHKDDDDLINHALSVHSPFGTKATFADLWHCNTPALAQTYPDMYGGGREYDQSSVDAALAQHLAFWTGNDMGRIQQLMMQSALVRDKWLDRSDYLPRTIRAACSRQTEWHRRKLAEVPRLTETTTHTEGPAVRSGHQFMAADQQTDYFQGCVYILRDHKILTPWGEMLKPDQFKAWYGGYVFSLTADHSKTTTDAYKAFTESQVLTWPKANGLYFGPGGITGSLRGNRDDTQDANMWVDPKVERVAGDVTPFITHLAKLLPVESDRHTVLCYMAAVVQHQGTKFQWCPLIQGTPGNGKSLLNRCVSNAVGHRYSFSPRVKELAERFNDWLVNRTFIGVEDVYFPERKLYVIETLKPMITAAADDQFEIEPKGKAKFSANLYCNFILNTNHKDAVRKEEDDRRFAIYYTAQQSYADLERDGMTGDYFPRLYRWLREDKGFAKVAEFLWSYPLPPEWVQTVALSRAPVTSSTVEAVRLSLGGVEQEVMEAVDSGRPGFVYPYISSRAFDELLKDIRAERRIPRNRRRAVLQSLGYDYHPALKDGRAHRVLTCDGGKPRIFIHADRKGDINDKNQLLTDYERRQSEKS